MIYRVGTIGLDSGNPLQIDETIYIWREVYGFKIEGLGGPSPIVAGSTLSFGTDDELYGGVLRFL